MATVERALGRLEGLAEQILAEQKQMREEFQAHCATDQQTASSLRMLVYKERDDLQVQIAALKTARAVMRGQLTLGQKTLVFIGGAVGAVLAVIEIWKNLAQR